MKKHLMMNFERKKRRGAMRRGICRDCRRYTELTKHSLIGHHRAPFVLLCRECHDKRDNIRPVKLWKRHPHGKYAKGTKRSHKKK